MKKSFIIASVVLMIAALTLPACKYEEGPAISLRTRKARVVNTWKIDRVFQNNNDITAYFNGIYSQYTLYLRDDNSYTLSWSSILSENGTWDFAYNQDGIITTPDYGGDITTWTILRLKNDELWLEVIDGGDTYEYQLITK